MIYFDNGATTYPKPLSVVRAVNAAMQRYGANPGRSGHRLSMRAGELVYRCRKDAAELFGVSDPARIILTDSCTTAVNTVLHGVLERGDHVVISSLEHNAVARPLEYLRQTRGVSYSVAEVFEGDDERTLDSFRRAINGKTRMLVCTAASNVFGVRLPLARLAALCRIYHLLFCVRVRACLRCPWRRSASISFARRGIRGCTVPWERAFWRSTARCCPKA